ncbi:hypothetical protein [Solibacillus sp. FSL K6-1523]|uniref:hypothetical protein n=1 Tax=Solibacillus sp. FSL K6-1523 TaxID=2921471 RepID=UPI0030F713B5
MDYIVHLQDFKPYKVKSVNSVEIKDGSYFLYDERGAVLLAVPRDKVKCILSKNIVGN